MSSSLLNAFDKRPRYGSTSCLRACSAAANSCCAYSQYQFGETELPAAGGVGVPVTVDAYLDGMSVFAGVEPAWYLIGDRPGRDWNTAEGAPGFGHEFAYFAGVGMKLGGWNVGASWRHTMTAYGEQNSFGASASFDGELGGKKKKGKGKKKRR